VSVIQIETEQHQLVRNITRYITYGLCNILFQSFVNL